MYPVNDTWLVNPPATLLALPHWLLAVCAYILCATIASCPDIMQISPDWKCIHHFFSVSDDQPLMMIIGSGKGMIIMLGEIADDEGGREEEEGEKEGGRGVG